MNKRFEQMNENFNKRFEDMISYLWMISMAFLGLTAATIGLMLWDRKTTIKAAKDEIIEEIEENKLKDFVYRLRDIAKKDKELAKVLREFHIL